MRSWAIVAVLTGSLACDSGTGGGTTGLDSGDTTEGGGLDEARLDRSQADGLCGYPGPGETGYGTQVGQRIANFGHPDGTTIIDCDGNEIEFADFMCERSMYAGKYPEAAPSDYQAHNRAILLSIGAGWCEPCIEETEELMPKVFEPLYPDGLEIVQIMFQDDDAQPPPKSFCREWRDERFDEKLEFFVVLDQTFGWADEFLLMPESSTPVTMLIDANANIRFKLEGEKPKNMADEARLVMANPYGD
jgi:hypothetical protein